MWASGHCARAARKIGIASSVSPMKRNLVAIRMRRMVVRAAGVRAGTASLRLLACSGGGVTRPYGRDRASERQPAPRRSRSRRADGQGDFRRA